MTASLIIGVVIVVAALGAALVVALPHQHEEIPATWWDGTQVRYGLVVDCGNAFAPTGACPLRVRERQILAGGITVLGLLVGVGLLAAEWRRSRRGEGPNRVGPPAAGVGQEGPEKNPFC